MTFNNLHCQRLNLNGLNLVEIPNGIPSFTKHLYANNNIIEKMDYLHGPFPENLICLYFGSNKIKKIENLPSKTIEFWCENNQITKIENLQKITTFNCSNNKITKIENLPETLKSLYCRCNQITKIENLPYDLRVLDFSNNQITKIENLPNDLRHLSCSNNPIKKIENLPKSLIYFTCKNCKIKKIINFPNNITHVYCDIKLNKTHKDKYIFPSLKFLTKSVIIENKIKIDKLPIELIEFIEKPYNCCFNCNKEKYIFKKIYKIHTKWNFEVCYLYCWECRKIL